ncbi:MAG: hypothetical protein ACKVOQ_01780 [Cyclobacteriaceae bacterium]
MIQNLNVDKILLAGWLSEAQSHRAIRYKSGRAQGQHTSGFPLLSLPDAQYIAHQNFQALSPHAQVPSPKFQYQ